MPVQAPTSQIPDRTLSFNSDTALYSLYLGIETAWGGDNENANIIIQAGDDFHNAMEDLAASRASSDNSQAVEDSEAVEDAVEDSEAAVDDAINKAVSGETNVEEEPETAAEEPAAEAAADPEAEPGADVGPTSGVGVDERQEELLDFTINDRPVS